jgi:hypothetical protein
LTDATVSASPAGPVTVTTDPIATVGRDRLVILVAYALAWGALLVNRGLYWDDWTLVGQTQAQLVNGAREFGVPWAGYAWAALLSMPLPGLTGHVLAFVAYLLSALVLHGILLRIPWLSRVDAVVAALTFAVLPVNYARIALVDLPYALSLLAFLAATWLLIRSIEGGGLLRRLAALGLYLFSFYTASLLVLYLVPVALAAAIAWKSTGVPFRSFVLRHADFIALPVAYWVLKTTFFTPSGVYDGYNALSMRGMAQVPRAMLSIPNQVLIEPLDRAVTVAGLLGILVGVAVAAWLVRRSRVAERGSFVSAPVLALAGAAMVGLGVFAYLVVGKTPVVWDWSSRHQLLVPLGAGLLAAAAARGARGGLKGAGRAGPAFAIAVGLLLGVSIVADARTLLVYQADWFKQVALQDAVGTIPELRTARHIRVVDTATELNALKRTYRFYEYNVLFELALGGTNRLVSDGVKEPSLEQLATFAARPGYHMGQYVPSPFDAEVRVSSSHGLPGSLTLFRLVVAEALGSPSFASDVSKLIEVRAVPITGAAPVP